MGKKVLLLLIVAILLFTLFACNEKTDEEIVKEMSENLLQEKVYVVSYVGDDFGNDFYFVATSDDYYFIRAFRENTKIVGVEMGAKLTTN